MKNYVKPAMELVAFQSEEMIMGNSVTGAAFFGVFGAEAGDLDITLN